MMQLLDRPFGDPSPEPLTRDLPAPTCGAGPPSLSARQLVVAVMTVGGSTPHDIALELALPVRAVQGHLHAALRILDLPRPEDLTHQIIASHHTPPLQEVQPQAQQVTALLLERAAMQEQLERRRVIEEQLTCALASRDSIGQAKGILMERYKISADAAFAVLARESSRSNRKLVDVARYLLYSGEVGGTEAEGS